MQGYNAIDELYYGRLHPSQKGYHENSDFAVAMDLSARHQKWLWEHLQGEEAECFEKFVLTNDEIVELMGRESFRSGFQLGVMLMIDSVSPNEETMYDL